MSKQVYILEDDSATRLLCKQLLERSGYVNGYDFSSGEELIEAIRVKEPDIIILDVFIEGKYDGIETARVITENFNIPHIFISNDLTRETFLRAKETNPVGYLTKPLNEKELITLLEIAVYNKNSYLEQARLSYEELKDGIVLEAGHGVLNFISTHVDLTERNVFVVSTTTLFNIQRISKSNKRLIVNLRKINDIRHLNVFFQSVNKKLLPNGVFVGCAETKGLRKKRILKKYPFGFNYFYYTLDFIFKRVFPKLSFTKKIYFFVTSGRNRVLSRAEVLGRLYSCGFKIIAEEFIENKLYFVAEKEKEPIIDRKPSYGPVFSMRRIGKNGKVISVYKFRTMHPFAEYLQAYVYEKNNLQSGGKIHNDFRITTLGRIFRRLWFDEIPMIYNLLNGDLKIVGVRPLSEHYLSLYPEDYRKFRSEYKPGLIPPFYYDLPKTLEEIVASEQKYLLRYKKSPILTDIRYFFKIFYNIIFKSARSK